MKVNIDFETFSKKDIKKVGAFRYAQDSSTEVICLSYALGDAAPLIYIAGDSPPVTLFNAIEEGALVYAYNTAFEYAIWKYVCIPKLNWPEVPFSQWRDTQAMSAYFSWPISLEKCALAMGLEQQKDKRGKYLIQKLCSPQKITKKNPHKRFTPDTHPELFFEMYEYCKQDVRTERNILNEFPWEIEGSELDVWRNTLIKNDIGIPVDVELVQSVTEMIDEYLEEVSELIPIITGGRIQTIGQSAKIREWCEELGYELPDFTADTIDKALADPEIEKFPKVKNLLEIRSLAGKSSIKKFKKILESVSPDGRVRGCLKYHKAGTGREGGRLIQPQNMPRASVPNVEEVIELFKRRSLVDLLEKHDDLLYTASALVRPSICVDLKNKMLVSDYSSVENRVVCWLAEQMDILEKIDGGLCLYTDMAADLYNLDYNEIDKESEMRRHGKLVVLGCGFSMGHKKFMSDCQARGFDITMEESKRSINVFRDKYSHVVDLWYGLKAAAEEATQDRGKITSYNAIQFMHHEGYLFMILPNGKPICYPEACLEEVEVPWGTTVTVTHSGINPRTKKWGRVGISPGRYAENATQGTAREILMEAQADLMAMGHKIFLTVHDEVVIESPISDGISIELINKVMANRSLVWEGLPLKAAGFETKRYHK